MHHMTRYDDGAVAGDDATATVDFENDCIYTRLSGNTENPNRTWVRYTPPEIEDTEKTAQSGS